MTTIGGRRVAVQRHRDPLLWEAPKVILTPEVLEIRNVGGSLHIAHKARHPDEWDLPVEPYDSYGPGDEFVDTDARCAATRQ